jgi:hypothetical protein
VTALAEVIPLRRDVELVERPQLAVPEPVQLYGLVCPALLLHVPDGRACRYAAHVDMRTRPCDLVRSARMQSARRGSEPRPSHLSSCDPAPVRLPVTSGGRGA